MQIALLLKKAPKKAKKLVHETREGWETGPAQKTVPKHKTRNG